MLFNYNIKNFNFRLIFYILCLNIIGIMVINSASGNDMDMVGRQIIGVLAGIFIAVFLSFIDYHKIVQFSAVIYAGSVFFLIAVLLLGRKVGGAVRWIVLPVIGQLQPSEFVKIGLIIFCAWFLSKYIDNINDFVVLLIFAVTVAFPILLILLEPDLSTSIVIVFTIACTIYVSGLSYKWIIGILCVLFPFGALFIYLLKYGLVPFLKDYQARRILAWVYPAEYADSTYQQDNSIMAIGSGQLSGKNLNNNSLSSVKNGNFLSEEQTDFIFAVIGEELGFIGCVAVILLFTLIVLECLWLANKSKDMQGRLICVGFAAMLSFQMFANIAVATGIFPNTGLTLPFVSYGVSSLISLYIGIGLVLNIGLQRRNTVYKEVYNL